MEGSVSLGPAERKRVMDLYRRHCDPAVRQRAHVILLLADRWSWSQIVALLYCSTRTVDRWKKRFEAEGIDGLLGRPRGRRSRFAAGLIAIVVHWVTQHVPRDFGFLRSRWSCGTLVRLAAEAGPATVSRETVRRWLHREGLVWRRPRPVLKPIDPDRPAKLKKLRALLRNLPPDEIAVFEDEVDVNLNPDIGSMWMPKGQQAGVETPGTNQKRYLAGSLNWRTGQVILTEGRAGEGRNSALFVRHLDELRCRLRCYRKIHVICDNAKFHDCQRVREYLVEHGDRVVLHFLPTWSPDTNPIERIWWHVHEEITRNHRCGTVEELLSLIFDWLEERRPFAVERKVYLRNRAA